MKYNPYYLNKNSYLISDNQNIRAYMIHKKIFKKNRISRIRQKITLIKHLDNYYNKNTIIIQNSYRSYVARNKYAQQLSKKFNNDTNLLGTEYVNIPKIFRYHLDKYFFDIRELNIHIKNHTKNPYTNIDFTEDEFNKILKTITDLTCSGHNISIILTENTNLKYSMLVNDFCTRLSEFGNYPDFTTFEKYSYYELLTYLKYVKKFVIISNKIGVEQYKSIIKSYNKYYRKYKNNIFVQSGPNNSPKLHSFLRKTMQLLSDLLTLDFDDDIRALILSDSIKTNILGDYNDKSYENYQQHTIDYDYESDLEERGSDHNSQINNLISYCDNQLDVGYISS